VEFEVASVKSAPPPEHGRGSGPMGFRGGPGTADPTRFTVDNYPLVMLIMRAYNVNRYQLSGFVFTPERFDITAKIPEGTTKEQFRLMLQNLLAERFKLKLHHETKELPVYELSVGKNGPTFKEHQGEAPLASMDNTRGPNPKDKDGYPMAPPGVWAALIGRGGFRGRFSGVAVTMPDFAGDLWSPLGRTVVDATGLKGKYDFVLTWSTDLMPPEAPPGAPPGGGAAGSAGPPPPPPPPSNDLLMDDMVREALMSSIQKQLGLRLEPKKGPVDTLVIDHLEKVPSEN
jgi:uncharacterized protein (TIGR03435 family)